MGFESGTFCCVEIAAVRANEDNNCGLLHARLKGVFDMCTTFGMLDPTYPIAKLPHRCRYTIYRIPCFVTFFKKISAMFFMWRYRYEPFPR